MKRIKIGITCYPSYGGSGVMATELGRFLARKGHEVHFITSSLPFRLSLRLEDNIYVHEVDTSSYPLFEHFPYTLALASKQKEVIEKYKLDILHVHYAIPHAISAYLVNLMMKEKAIPFVTTLHGTDITIVGKDANFFDITCLAIQCSQAVTTVSNYLKKETQNLFLPKKKIETIYNFIDFEIFIPQQKEEKRQKFLSNAKGTLLIHISNFRAVKQTTTVIKTFYEVQKITAADLIMVGSGPDLIACQKMVKDWGIENKVHFLGEQEEVATLINLSDILLFPSKMESFGLVVLEAMACEIPVVACDSGGITEVVEHGKTGFLSPVGDVSSLIKYSVRLAKDKQLRLTMGKSARKRAMNLFHPDVIVKQYENLYQRVLQCWLKT